MSDSFQIIIEYKGCEKTFDADLLIQGYSYKIKVIVDEKDIYFEPDNEGSYRVISMPWQNEKDFEKLDHALLFAIRQKIEEILR